MAHTYTVRIRRTWDERYSVTIEAATPDEALEKANHDEDDMDFDWDNVESAEREVLFIDDDQTHQQVYSVDAAANGVG